MAQVHALLLVAAYPLSADAIMQALNISRGNANMNLRALMDWGLVMKEHKAGDRREYFYAEQDIWKAARLIIANRKKRELEPITDVLQGIAQIEGEGIEVETFTRTIKDLQELTTIAETILDKMSKSERNFFLNTLLRIIK